MDEEDGDIVYPLKDIVYGCRKGEVLLICTKMNTVIPVNLEQLSDADYKSVMEMLKVCCPKLSVTE